MSACRIALAAALLWGCSPEAVGSGDGTTVNVAFSLSMDSDLHTRAIGDASGISEVVVAVFRRGEHDSHEMTLMRKLYEMSYPFSIHSSSNTISVPLVKGEEYSLLFWAQDGSADAYDIMDNGCVAVDYRGRTGGFASMEKLDAFCATAEVDANPGTGSRTIRLRRPLAQLNFLNNGGVMPAEGTHRMTVRINGLPSVYNPFSGETVAMDPEYREFSFADFTGEELATADGNSYPYMASVYMFPCRLDGAGYAVGDAPMADVGQRITMESNNRTNIIGNFITNTNTN